MRAERAPERLAILEVLVATCPERVPIEVFIVITTPERMVTSEVRLARFTFVRSREPEREMKLFPRVRTRPERDETVVFTELSPHERVFILLSFVLILHERVFIVPERASCAREVVK